MFLKFVFPALWLGFALFWSVGVAFVSGVKGGGGPSPLIGCFGLVLAGVGFYNFRRYHFPLKEVWLTPSGLWASNFRTAITIPYAAIASVVQMTQINLLYVVVELADETPFGRRFTFVPRNPKRPWPFSRGGEDDVVIALRARIDEARKLGGRKPGGDASPGRSVMADRELDGPF